MTRHNALVRTRSWMSSRILLFQQWTWRLKVEGRDDFYRMVENGDRFILCFWHGKYVPILPILRGMDGCVFTSATRNGDIIARILRDFGFRCTQIPDRGGRRSLQLMQNALLEVNVAGVAVDGPLGPYHQVKRGVILLASNLGFRLVPVSMDARHKYILTRRWDLMEIPLPFTRVSLVMGEPMAVPSSLDHGGVAAWSSKLRQALDAADARAASLAGEGTIPRQISPD